MAKTVVGLFDTWAEAQSVVQDLVDNGFRREDISLVANNASGEFSSYTSEGDHAADGAMAGAGTGALVGGVLGLLVGVGALAIPGVGPVLAAGPLAATLTGAGIGAVAGGLLGALTDLGVPEEDAGYYSEGVRRGGTLVTVRADDNMADQAVSLMNRHGAVDIDERASTWQSSGWSGYSADAEPYSTDQITTERSSYTAGSTMDTGTSGTMDTNRTSGTMDTNRTSGTMDTNRTTDTTTTSRNLNDGEQVLPIVEEQLAVGKRQVERGGVRIYSRVTEQPVQEQVTLREENVTVDRRPVNREVSTGDLDTFREGVIEVTETDEEAIVAKTARVVEEVVVGKTVEQRTETINDTVRRTDVEVEQVGGTGATSGTTWETVSTGFRSNFDTNYANSGYTYEQFTPAYRYGYDLAGSGRGGDWTSVEADARRGWEERNPGTWEQFQGAVRHAWDSASGSGRR